MKDVEFMKAIGSIVILFALVPAQIGFAQAPATQPSQPGPKAVATQASVPPEQQATREQLTKLFEVMRLRQQFDDMMRALPSVVQQQVRTQMGQLTAKIPGGQRLTPEQQKALDKLMNKYMERTRTLYPADEMIADAIAVYQRHMTREDADAYIAFFSSPAGQHLLDAQPAIMKEYMPIAMDRAERRTHALTVEMAADLAEFSKSAEPAKQVPAK
jgi:uncharacterized protein